MHPSIRVRRNRRKRPQDRLTRMLRMSVGASAKQLTQPGWPRWNAVMEAATEILGDLRAEIENSNIPDDGYACRGWQEAFKKRLERVLEYANDPFFDI